MKLDNTAFDYDDDGKGAGDGKERTATLPGQ